MRNLMPLIGTLSEFALPEVIHLIGQRHGILRLLDVTETDPIEMELFRGNLCSFQIGNKFLGDTKQITQDLSAVIQSGNGLFEFTERREEEPEGSLRMPVNMLVMDIVLMADELNGLKR